MKKLFLILLSIVALGFSRPNEISAQAGKADALETIGSLAGLLMYNTYTTIGSIGDGLEENSYDASYVSDVMDEQTGGLDAVIAQLKTLKTSGFLTDASDKEFLVKCIETFELLKKQAVALKEYAGNKSEANADVFQEYRQEAWHNIAELLGIAEE